jgi:hypothetical protein
MENGEPERNGTGKVIQSSEHKQILRQPAIR